MLIILVIIIVTLIARLFILIGLRSKIIVIVIVSIGI